MGARTILLTFALATSAWAQQVTTHLVLPSYGGSGRQLWRPNANNALACWRVPARLGITGATKLAIAIPVNTPLFAACTVGAAIYTDTDNTAPLISLSGDCSHVGIRTGIAAAFNLVQGTIYRLCICLTHQQGGYLGVGEFNALLGATKSDVMNAAVLRAAITASPCIAGTVPLTGTGAMVTAIPPSVIDNAAAEVPQMVVE